MCVSALDFVSRMKRDVARGAKTPIDQFGEPKQMLASGLGMGTLFGFAAYRSSFCLRAATVEVAEVRFGPKLTIWLVAFSFALPCAQMAIYAGLLDVATAR